MLSDLKHLKVNGSYIRINEWGKRRIQVFRHGGQVEGHGPPWAVRHAPVSARPCARESALQWHWLRSVRFIYLK